MSCFILSLLSFLSAPALHILHRLTVSWYMLALMYNVHSRFCELKKNDLFRFYALVHKPNSDIETPFFFSSLMTNLPCSAMVFVQLLTHPFLALPSSYMSHLVFRSCVLILNT